MKDYEGLTVVLPPEESILGCRFCPRHIGPDTCSNIDKKTRSTENICQMQNINDFLFLCGKFPFSAFCGKPRGSCPILSHGKPDPCSNIILEKVICFIKVVLKCFQFIVEMLCI